VVSLLTMPILRLLTVAAMAIFALVAGFFAAVIVAISALLGLVSLRITRRRTAQPSSPTPPPRRNTSRHDAIDIEAEEVGRSENQARLS